MSSGLRGYNVQLDEVKLNGAEVGEGVPFQITGLSAGVDYSERITIIPVDNAGNPGDPVTVADIEGPESVVTTPIVAGDPMSAENRLAVDGHVAALMKPHTATDGVLVGIRSPDGDYSQAYGGDRSGPLNLTQKMRYGSITKMYTCRLILEQIEAGHLSFDDTLDQFVTAAIPNKNKVTVRHLVMMQSGILDYLQQDPAVQQNYFLSPTTAFDPMTKIPTYAPLYEPGTSASYSNSNTVLLGMILEWCDAQYGTGRDIRTIMIEDCLTPLGLLETGWPTGNYM